MTALIAPLRELERIGRENQLAGAAGSQRAGGQRVRAGQALVRSNAPAGRGSATGQPRWRASDDLNDKESKHRQVFLDSFAEKPRQVLSTASSKRLQSSDDSLADTAPEFSVAWR